MRLPLMVTVLGYVGFVPFLIGPGWLYFAPESAPAWLDRAWTAYVVLLAAFLAGTFRGFALPAIQEPAGMLGAFIASVLILIGYSVIAVPTGIYTAELATSIRESPRMMSDTSSVRRLPTLAAMPVAPRRSSIASRNWFR